MAAALVERSRAHEQKALANRALQDEAPKGAAHEAAEARARVHDAWASMHEELAQENELRAEGDDHGAAMHRAHGEELKQLARAAEELAHAAEQRQAAAELAEKQQPSSQVRDHPDEAARRRRIGAREDEIRARIERRRHDERRGLRRFRPGPGIGSAFFSPGMVGTSGPTRREPAEGLERDVDVIARALQEHGVVDRRELARIVGARYWGPGRFRQALHVAIDEGLARRRSQSAYGPRDPRDDT